MTECVSANITVSVLVINTIADNHQHHLEKVEWSLKCCTFLLTVPSDPVQW